MTESRSDVWWTVTHSTAAQIRMFLEKLLSDLFLL